MIMIANYLPLVILMPFTTKLIKKFGKKELCSIGAYIAAAAYLAGLIVHTTNPYVFLVILFASGFGIAFFTLEVWAMVSDAIDYQEKLTGHREEGTSYAVYSFFRKVGQTLAGVGANAALGFVGYQVGTTAIIQDAAVTNGIYVIATLIPFIVYLVQGLLLHLAYPLSRDRVEELQKIRHPGFPGCRLRQKAKFALFFLWRAYHESFSRKEYSPSTTGRERTSIESMTT